MMPIAEIVLWGCLALTAYTFVGYPLLIGLLARWFGRAPRRDGVAPRSVSLLLAAYNEERRIGPRLEELQQVLEASGTEWEIILVSDGSWDATLAEARRVAGPRVQLVELPQKQGKACALARAAALARHEVLLLADVRQHWPLDAVPRLLETFTDPTVGAVSGDLVLESTPGMLAGVGLYWRYEKWLRRQESVLFAMVGATGAISAVRRELFRPPPPGTILDDVYWPLQVALQGYRVIHNPEAHAFDRLPARTRDEMRRKVRTLTGNFQLLTLLPVALLPWRNPIWVQLISHKVLRLVAPWCLLVMLALSALLPGRLYQMLFWLQGVGYLLGVAGMAVPGAQRLRLISAAGSFLALNAAAWVAFWVWITGGEARAWRKVAYDESRAPEKTGARKDDPVLNGTGGLPDPALVSNRRR